MYYHDFVQLCVTKRCIYPSLPGLLFAFLADVFAKLKSRINK